MPKPVKFAKSASLLMFFTVYDSGTFNVSPILRISLDFILLAFNKRIVETLYCLAMLPGFSPASTI